MLPSQFFWIILCALFVVFYLGLHKNTVFGINFKRHNFGGAVILFEIVFFILPAVVIISTVDVSSYAQARHTHLPEVKYVSGIILYALLMFTLTIKICSMVFKRAFVAPNDDEIQSGFMPKVYAKINDRRIIKFLLSLILSGIIILFAGTFIWGIKHAVLMAIINHGDLLSYRLANRYDSSVPGPVLTYFRLVTYSIAIVAGSKALDKRVALRSFAIFSFLFFATFSGGKALPLRSILFCCLSYISFHDFRFTFRRIFICMIIGILFMGISYCIFSLQYKNISLDWLLQYIFLRVGVGQMMGTYEQFALNLRNIEYIWHAVPFASFFVDYPIHAKDLMIISENIVNPAKTGVKNSFFISEALAMGGFPLVFFSPIIFGIGYAAGFLLFNKFMMNLFGVYEFKKAVFLIYVSFFCLTGDFSSVFFFKGLLLLIIMMTFPWAVYLFLSMIIVAIKSQKKSLLSA